MNETSVEALISQLSSFRTRSAAADALAAMGRDAVQPLLDALEQEANEDSTWTLLNCLGQIGAIEAVPALARYLEDGDYQTVAHDALVRITGRDFGAVAADWTRWMEQKEATAGEVAASTGAARGANGELTDERLLELALQGSGAGWRAEAENRYAVDVPLPGGGKQRVDVVFGGRDHEGSEIAVVYSLCGEARPDQYEAALRRNLRMPYGALALRESGGKQHFVMFNTILRKDLSPVELRKSVLTVGERSDRVARSCEPPPMTRAPSAFACAFCRRFLPPEHGEHREQMLKRTHSCGELRIDHLGQEAVVSGWVANWRDHGGLAFIDLRDRTGLAQVVFRPEVDAELHSRARDLRSEYCVSVRGTVEQRPPEMENPNLPTGQVEVLGRELEVHSTSDTPPFEVQGSGDVSMELRLRYRYLDMRRPQMLRNLVFRHRTMQMARRYLDENGFIEVETPFLTKSTPEGARDYLVPSRVNPGQFYALPQSPQLFKQLLMVGGLERYFQIVKCFRDEDLRANRQPEFTQIDVEMSFVDEDDVLAMTEGLMQLYFRELLDRDLPLPLARIRYEDAFRKYGTDAPDLRFGLEIADVSDIAAECGFRVFSGAVAQGGQVRGICVPGGADMPRSQVDGLVEWIKQFGAGGLAWFKLRDGKAEGGVAKFFSDGELAAIRERFGAQDGSLVLTVADRRQVCNLALSHLRQHLARERDLIPADSYALCWVVEAPAFERDELTDRLTFAHHPFTSPVAGDADLLEDDPTAARTRSYDLVLNGQEIAGGSIRISDPSLQMRILKILGYTEEEVHERFGFLMDALRYGPPPHGGIAFGFDRAVATMLGLDDIREVIAFPKTQRAVCLLTGAPSPVDEAQLGELGLSLDLE